MRQVRRTAVVVTLATVTLGTLGALISPVGAGPADRARTGAADDPVSDARPNIVLVLVDDMRADDLDRMPATRRLLGNHGAEFTNAYATFPLCCPSRASILTGQYPHNTGVLDNVAPLGGYSRFDDSSTIATWLDSSGYATGYVGKYLNEYSKYDRLHVPPGWDSWEALIGGIYAPTEPNAYNVDGAVVRREGYQTDVLTDRATAFLESRPAEPKFLHLSYVAPHTSKYSGEWQPPRPAPRHEFAFDGLQAPSGPAYDEVDMTDKPAVLQPEAMPEADIAYTHQLAEARAESLLSVDEGVERLVETLRSTGELDNTYIVFTSDNGYFLGEHRRRSGKVEHYEPVSKVPLLMAGPGVPPGRVVDTVVGLHDLAPTFLALADASGAQGATAVDGIDMLPFAKTPRLLPERDLLIQARRPRSGGLSYHALRTDNDWKFVRYFSGATELYDLETDRHELDNLAGLEAFAAREKNLSRRLVAIRDCAGETCQ